MTTAIMFVTYNRLELTKQTIAGLEKTIHMPVHLIIIDNGSTDGTAEYLQELSIKNPHFKDTFIFNEENKGIAYARNQALLIANHAKWLCTIDNDVHMPDNWLQTCIDILTANPTFASVGVNMEGAPYPLETHNGFTFQVKPAGNLGTACMVFNVSLHKMLGFFNYKDYGTYSCDDADFGARIRALGLKLGYILEMGTHLGDNEVGEYREWKTSMHKKTLATFKQNCSDYFNRKKTLYIPFKEYI